MPKLRAEATAGPDEGDCMMTREPREGRVGGDTLVYTRGTLDWREPMGRAAGRPGPASVAVEVPIAVAVAVAVAGRPLRLGDPGLDEDEQLGAGGDGARDAHVEQPRL